MKMAKLTKFNLDKIENIVKKILEAAGFCGIRRMPQYYLPHSRTMTPFYAPWKQAF